jgi:hypothetical protein
VAGYYSATRPHRAAAPLADFLTAAYTREWQIEIKSDQRFKDAVERAYATVPDDVRVDIDRLSAITEGEVAEFAAQRARAQAELQSKYAKAHVLPLPPARASLEFHRRHELDWLFFRRWRLPDGWLPPEEAKRALQIFHDPLSIEMRCALMARLHPDRAFLASR